MKDPILEELRALNRKVEAQTIALNAGFQAMSSLLATLTAEIRANRTDSDGTLEDHEVRIQRLERKRA